MLNIHEADILFHLDDDRRKTSRKVQALYDRPITIGNDLEKLKKAHVFFKELKRLLKEEALAVGNMERFLESVIKKYS